MNSEQKICSKSDILSFFYNAPVPNKELLIGIEIERSAVFSENLKPVSYLGDNGYLAILKKLVTESGWIILSKDQDGNISALKRGESEIHIEDDGRLELVSKPQTTLSSLSREFQMHLHEINETSKAFGIRWIAIGRKPFATNKEIIFSYPKNNKEEHDHYQKYYPEWSKKEVTGFEKKNDGIHVNFGYTSEKDAIEKFQTLLKVSPILMGMFANSPFNSKKFSGFLTKRNHSNSQCCPPRTQIQEIFFTEDFSFEKWVDYLLQLPMSKITRKGKRIFIPLTFDDYLKNGFKKHRPRMEDFYLHIKSVFSEMRIKHYLEYRGFDMVPPHLLPSVPAIIHAITMNSEVMQKCQNLVKNWTFADQLEMRERVYKDALQAKIPQGGKVLDLAKELLEIASTALKEKYKNKHGASNPSRFLWPIKEYVFIREQSPAEYIMEMWNGEWHRDPRKLIEWSEK